MSINAEKIWCVLINLLEKQENVTIKYTLEE